MLRHATFVFCLVGLWIVSAVVLFFGIIFAGAMIGQAVWGGDGGGMTGMFYSLYIALPVSVMGPSLLVWTLFTWYRKQCENSERSQKMTAKR